MTNNTYDSPTRFGYEILRDHVLPSILGKHEDDILYWAGKDVARKFPVFKVEELPTFFYETGWGNLSLEKSTKDEAFYTMKSYDGTNVQNRSCRLEAGFIAQQYQKLNGLLTECFGEVDSKGGLTRFHVKWDLKAKIDS